MSIISLFFVFDTSNASTLYFNSSNSGDDRSKIRAIETDGTNLQTIISHGPHAGRDLEINLVEEKIYYGVSHSGLFRSDLNGNNIESIYWGNGGDFELDVDNNKIYFQGSSHDIQKINTDGTDREIIFTTNATIGGLGIDISSGYIYYSEYDASHSSDVDDGGRIMRTNLDGSVVEVMVDLFDWNWGFPSSTLSDVELDLQGGKIYWTDQTTQKIQRADLDGTNVETLVEDWGRHIALDLIGGKIYWGDPYVGILRANLDGSEKETFYANNLDVMGMAIGPAPIISPPAPDPVPEPTTMLLFGLGLLSLAGVNRKRLKK